ncbi:MAG TPA: LysR substrate-binding domain-containing protein [Thermoleophilaceae bacterium]|nr:LysR substrate-binding domain-containing protein [Thermoleophilaceae bacterium]
MLDVKRLRVLREVAAQSSFSAAAQKLGYTQSAVSQQIAALEREAGAVLIERNPRGIRLTDAGEALVRHADKILARLAEAEAELEAIAGLRGGRLRVATFPTAGATLVPRAIREFNQRHPEVELSLTEAEPNESLPLLKAGELDLVLVDDSDVQDDVDVELIPLLDDPMHLALPADHPLAARERVRLADVADEPWIHPTVSCPCLGHVQTACKTAGFEPRVAYESDDFQVVQGLVAAGVGVALIPALALISERPDVVIRPLGPRAPFRKILAAALADGYRSPAVTEMIEILGTIAKDYEAPKRLAAAS